MTWLMLAAQLWTSSPDPLTILSGTWQTCVEVQGDHMGWAERVFDHYRNGKVEWEFHMGPQDEFALFKAPHELECEDEVCDRHDGKDNLLGPAYRVGDVQTWRGKRQWTVPSLRLWISVVEAGNAPEGCYSFFLLIKRTK